MSTWHDFRFWLFMKLIRLAIGVCPEPERANFMKAVIEYGKIKNFVNEHWEEGEDEAEVTITWTKP